MKKIVLTFTALSFLVVTAIGQTNSNNYTDKKKDWGFVITPYALLASQSTDVGGQKLRQSFSDLYSITNAGFQIVTIVLYKKLSLRFDGTIANLGDNGSSGPLQVDLNIKQKILDLSLGYTVYDNFEFSEEEILKGWDLNFSIGTKYWSNDLGINYSIVFDDFVLDTGSIEETEDWWDLMLGVKTNFVLSKKFQLTVGANVGGFGIGNSSKLAYDFIYLNSFKVSKLMVINAGFRNFRYHRIDGEGTDALETTVNVLGPVLGVSFVL